MMLTMASLNTLRTLACAWMLALLLSFQAVHAQAPETADLTGKGGDRILSAAEIEADLSLLYEAFSRFHPGLYRYQDSVQFNTRFEALKKACLAEPSLKAVYVSLSRFTAQIRCGHTYCNFWNQPDSIANALFRGKDKLPLTFRIVEGKMVVYQNVSEVDELQRGDEILSINGLATKAILDTLMRYVKADGSNDAKRLNDLQLLGGGKYEFFDVFFPMLYPPVGGTYTLSLRRYGMQETYTRDVKTLTRAERLERLNAKYGKQATNFEDLWQFELLDEKTAYLRLGTFVTWHTDMDWQAFLKGSFAQLNEKEVPHLIVDLRGNEGGDGAVQEALMQYLGQRDAWPTDYQQYIRYKTVSDELRPHLNTWNKGMYDISRKVSPSDRAGFYQMKGGGKRKVKKANKQAFKGKVWLLVDASNSSATFFLSQYFQINGLATLVGQTTGGNLRGINGGQQFFLALPNSGIGVDIPLIGYYTRSEQPDAGLSPDIEVPFTVEDLVEGVDTELQAVRKQIRQY